MKKRLLVIGAAFIGAMLLWLTGYFILSGNTHNGAHPQIENAEAIYRNSIAEIIATQDITLNISKTQKTNVGNDVFLETSQQALSYLGLGTENMRAALNETLTIDDHRVQITEFYANGTGYTTVNNGAFLSTINAKDYQNRFAPAVLLDPSRYYSITGFDTGTDYMIRFEQPVTVEPWALYEGMAFMRAEGTAYVSYTGQLIESTYALTYQRGNATIRLTFKVEPEALPTIVINPPEDTSGYVAIEYFDAPRMLERATGYLLQADDVSAKYSDDIYFQAFGDRRTQEITLHTAVIDDDWSALVQTQSHLSNESKVGMDSQLKKTELFKNGSYQSANNDSQWVTNQEVTADNMHTYCKNQLIGTVMLPEYITGAQIEQTESTLRIVFSGSESFAPLICSNICQTLYQKPELLNDIAQSNTTNTLQCYLELDKNTSLPVASGIHYDGTFTFEGVPYTLRFKADQIYDILSQTAQVEIEKAGA